MNKNVIFHNPRCQKSRATLALLEQKNVDVDIIEYLKLPPSKSDLKFICEQLKISPTQLLRAKEKTFSELSLSLDDKRTDNQWIQILHDNPILIERPIVVVNGKVAIGRPPENVLNIL